MIIRSERLLNAVALYPSSTCTLNANYLQYAESLFTLSSVVSLTNNQIATHHHGHS